MQYRVHQFLICTDTNNFSFCLKSTTSKQMKILSSFCIFSFKRSVPCKDMVHIASQNNCVIGQLRHLTCDLLSPVVKFNWSFVISCECRQSHRGVQVIFSCRKIELLVAKSKFGFNNKFSFKNVLFSLSVCRSDYWIHSRFFKFGLIYLFIDQV